MKMYRYFDCALATIMPVYAMEQHYVFGIDDKHILEVNQ